MRQERLLYESHGCSAKIKTLFTGVLIFEGACAALMLLLGILFFPIANSDDDLSALIVIFMMVIVLIAIIVVCSMMFSSYKKCWIQLYETGIAGKPFIPFGTSSNQQFCYQDIQSASIQTLFLIIQVNGVQHKFISSDNQRALQIINSSIYSKNQYIYIIYNSIPNRLTSFSGVNLFFTKSKTAEAVS